MNEYRVLIVDDEVEFLTTLAERLQIRGIQTEIATEGESALKKIETNPPQVVVLDVMMPGMGGIEILQQMKKKGIQIPVILLTGYGSTDQNNEILDLGAVDCLMKPCDLDALINKIQKAVKNS